MQKQRPHDERVARGGGADDLGSVRAEPWNVVGRQAAEPVRTGDHTERTVRFVDGVKVQADGNHLSQNVDRGLNMVNAVLDGPGAKARDVAALADGNGEILVPRDKPIGGRRFVEENGADGAGCGEGCVRLWKRRCMQVGRKMVIRAG